jgi:hypothetical protein
MRSDSRVSSTLCQGRWIEASENFMTRETQRIDPISVCELEAGSPIYHVPKFQMIAAMRRERTAQTQKAILELAIFSRGRSFMIPIATPVPQTTTPRKLKNAASRTAFFAESEFE